MGQRSRAEDREEEQPVVCATAGCAEWRAAFDGGAFSRDEESRLRSSPVVTARHRVPESNHGAGLRARVSTSASSTTQPPVVCALVSSTYPSRPSPAGANIASDASAPAPDSAASSISGATPAPAATTASPAVERRVSSTRRQRRFLRHGVRGESRRHQHLEIRQCAS